MLGPALALLLAAGQPLAAPFAPDEQMQFAISYIGMTMGKARISVGHREGRILPVILQAGTSGAIGFVTIREQLTSYLDVETGLPRIFSLDAVEPNNYRHTNRTRFDREAGTATVREVGRHEVTTEVAVPPGTLDFVALVFRLRTLPLDPGNRHEFHVLSGSKVSTVVAEVVGRETIDTRAGKFPAVKVRVPTGFDGKFSEKSPTFVWFSDDGRRIVVRISTDFAIGRALAELVSYDAGRAGG